MAIDVDEGSVVIQGTAAGGAPTPPLVSAAAPMGATAAGSVGSHPIRSLDHFIDPPAGGADPVPAAAPPPPAEAAPAAEANGGEAQRSLAGFLTAAAAHVDTQPE